MSFPGLPLTRAGSDCFAAEAGDSFCGSRFRRREGG
jgi:hypothetical protein